MGNRKTEWKQLHGVAIGIGMCLSTSLVCTSGAFAEPPTASKDGVATGTETYAVIE